MPRQQPPLYPTLIASNYVEALSLLRPGLQSLNPMERKRALIQVGRAAEQLAREVETLLAPWNQPK